MSERKTRKDRHYSIEEKNEIVQMYLSGQTAGIRSIIDGIIKTQVSNFNARKNK